MVSLEWLIIIEGITTKCHNKDKAAHLIISHCVWLWSLLLITNGIDKILCGVITSDWRWTLLWAAEIKSSLGVKTQENIH